MLLNKFLKLKNVKKDKQNYYFDFADKIQWKLIESMYYNDIKNKEYSDFSIRLIIGSLIIQDRENLSFEKTIEKIKERLDFQYFVGIHNLNDLNRFDKNILEYYRNNIEKNILTSIYNIITQGCAYKGNDINIKDDYFNNSTLYLIVLGCLLGHCMFLSIFLIINENILVVVNLLSISTYLLCIYLTKKRKTMCVILLTCIELLFHAIMCIIYLGWDSGFQYYILGIIPIIVLNQNFKSAMKYLIACITFSIYIITLEIVIKNHVNIINNYNYLFGSMNIFIVFVFMTFIIYRYNKQIQESNLNLKILNLKFKINSECDQLTGLFNRRYMMQILSSYKEKFDNEKKPFSIAIADIDKFKNVNDNYGHQFGDLVLIETSYKIRKALKENEVMARWGGEEFLFVFFNEDLQTSYEKIDNLRKIVSENIINNEGISQSITITAGIEIYDGTSSIDNVLKTADMYLYYGKQNGRNKVISKLK